MPPVLCKAIRRVALPPTIPCGLLSFFPYIARTVRFYPRRRSFGQRRPVVRRGVERVVLQRGPAGVDDVVVGPGRDQQQTPP